MQPVSSKFLAAVQQSHNVVVKLEILSSGSVVYSLTQDSTTANNTSTTRITDGSVTMAKTNATRSQSSLKIVDPTFSVVPTSSSSLITPYGNEMRLYRGIRFSDGTEELVRLCTNRISEVAVNDTAGGVELQITGYGRERQVSRNVVSTYWPTTTTQGYPLTSVSYATYIQTLIADRYPLARFDASAALWTLQQYDPTWSTPIASTYSLSEGSDPISQAKSMADNVMCDLYANRDGTFTFIRDPNLSLLDGNITPTPVASFTEGSTATFLSLKRTFSDVNTFNVVVVTGEGTVFGLPFRSAPAQDNDPNSPTFINGPYGSVVHTETSPFAYTQVQVDQYAQLILRRSLGAQDTVEMPTIVNPALDVDDCIQITRKRAGLTNVLYIIDSVTIPLKATDSMKVKTRERRSLR